MIIKNFISKTLICLKGSIKLKDEKIVGSEKIISENFSDNFWTGSAKHLQIFNRTQNNSSKLNANSKKKKYFKKSKKLLKSFHNLDLKKTF